MEGGGITLERVVHDGRAELGFLERRRSHSRRRVHLEQPWRVVLSDHEVRTVQLKCILHEQRRTTTIISVTNNKKLSCRRGTARATRRVSSNCTKCYTTFVTLHLKSLAIGE